MTCAYDTHPQPGRAVVSAAHAAKLLHKDVRTIRTMITSGSLRGVREAAGSRFRWLVYADQLQSQSTPSTAGIHQSPDRSLLAEENAQLRAKLADAEEANRSLLGAQAVLLDALRSYRQGSEQILAAQAALEEVVALQRSATTSFQSSSNQFAEALSAMRDVIAAATTPSDARDLTSERLR